MGYEGEVAKIQDLFLEGRKDEAIASVPMSLVEDVALVGPVAKGRDELERWRETVMTTILVSGGPDQLRQIAGHRARLGPGRAGQARFGQRSGC